MVYEDELVNDQPLVEPHTIITYPIKKVEEILREHIGRVFGKETLDEIVEISFSCYEERFVEITLS